MAFDLQAALQQVQQQEPPKPSMTGEYVPGKHLGSAELLALSQQHAAQMTPQQAEAQGIKLAAPSSLESFGRGMADVWEGGKVAGERAISHLPGTDTEGWQDKADQEVSHNLDDEGQYQLGRGPNAGIDWWRIGGNVAATLPLTFGGGGGLLAAGARGALSGAVQGGLIGEGRGEGLEGAVLGAATGGVLGPIGYKIGTAISSRLAARFAANRANAAVQQQVEQALADHGIDPVHAPGLVQEATQMLAARGTLDAGALARRANLEDLGLEPTNAQVTRNFADWQAERDLSEQAEGAGLKNRYIQQQQRLRDLLGQFRDQFGGATGDMREAGDSVIQALRAKYGELQGAVSNLYRAVSDRPGMDATGVVRPTALRTALEEAKPYLDAGLAPRAQAAQGVLEKLLQGAGRTAEGLAEAEPAQGLSLNGAELLRRRIGQLAADSTDRTERGLLNQLRSALDDDVFGAVGSDEFSAAREAARQRFAEFESGPLQAAVEKGVEPDKFLQKYVLGGDVAGIRSLRNSLTEGNALQQTRGTQAWNDLRQQAADWIIQKATNGHPDNPVSQAALTRALNQIGPARLREIFGTEELAGLRRLETASRDISLKPQFATVNPSGTAYTAARMLRGSIGHELLSRIPLARGVQAVRDSRAAVAATEDAMGGGLLSQADRESLQQAAEARLAAGGGRGARAGAGLAPAAVGALQGAQQ